MKKILDIIRKTLKLDIVRILCSALDAVKSFFQYKKTNAQNKIDERNQKNEEQYCKKVDKITKDGSLDDLLDLRRK